jgi:hypothetical protein
MWDDSGKSTESTEGTVNTEENSQRAWSETEMSVTQESKLLLTSNVKFDIC